MHNSNVPLLTWFLAAEKIVQFAALYGTRSGGITGHALKDALGISYLSARRIRSAVSMDLLNNESILRKCVCNVAKIT